MIGTVRRTIIPGAKRRTNGLTDSINTCMTPKMIQNIIMFQRKHNYADFSKALRALIETGLKREVS